MTAPYQSKLIPYEDYIRRVPRPTLELSANLGALLSRHGLKAAEHHFSFCEGPRPKAPAGELPAKPSPQQPQTTMANGFFEPKPANPTHEIRNKKWKVSPVRLNTALSYPSRRAAVSVKSLRPSLRGEWMR